MARTTERINLTLPIEFCDRLRNKYPHRDFASLIMTLLMYADAAGFMRTLDCVDDDDWKEILTVLEDAGLAAMPKPKAPKVVAAKKSTKKQVDEAMEELEVFGA